MGKASREKWERKLRQAVQITSQNSFVASQSPWYESQALWFGVATVVTIVLTVVVAAMKGDLRWLLCFAWAASVYPIWIISNNIGIGRRSFKIIFFLVVLSLGGWAFYELYGSLTPQEHEPIAVSPPEVKLTNLFDPSKRLRGHIDLSVYNRGDDPYYQIWVEIIIDSEFLSSETIDLDFPTLEERARAGEEPREVMVSAMCLRGVDMDSHKAFLCTIDSLHPGKAFLIKMTSNYNTAHLSDEQIGRASVKVIRFLKEPGEHYDNFPHKAQGAASQRGIPVGFKSTTMIYFCPDIGEAWKSPSPITCTPNSKRY